ncbi:hypothetical protein BJV74DRAFT_846602 [Russula compacta]|nr:hypothetical protein BJV74DRAFT_846602 [Russula compacta]
MSSSETTQILFNSAALHSLKRDQLVKLCKIHSIKASGKNTELIQKLKDHAATLPHASPLSVATRSKQHQDDKGSVSSRLDSQRPSDQWEVIMEDIPELPEGSSRSAGSSLRSVSRNAPDEFGTGASSVSSSLRAIANSFNFKRATSNKPDDDRLAQPNITDALASHSVPYSSIPEPPKSDMPQTDHFKFSTPDSTMDEHIYQPGPAPATTMDGTPGPPRTTIRLVSASNPNPYPTLSPEPGTPHLRPVDPPFDLVMGSPNAQGQSHVPVWPLSPQPQSSERWYPVLPIDELNEVNQRQEKSSLPPSNTVSSQASVGTAKIYPRPKDDIQDLFSPASKVPSKQKESVGIPRSDPFLFGSPLPRHSVSNKDFDTAAASVLQEMNKRLSAAGVQKVGVDVFGTIPTVTAAANANGNPRASSKVDRFDKAHEEQFNKMDSIATHYAARRGAPDSKKRKSDVLGHGSAPAGKRSSAADGIPGAFDDEEEVVEDVQEEGDRRMSKRVRILEEDGGKDKGRRLTISPMKTETEEKQAERERAATRKMLQAKKEKRRNKGKAMPRFGFLSSAKSIVRSVWNFGVGSPSKASRTGTATPATMSKTVTGAAEPPKETKPPPPKKPSLAALRPSEAVPNRKGIAPARTGSMSDRALKMSGDGAKDGASRSRPPSLSRNTGAKMLNAAPAFGSTSSRQSVRASSAYNPASSNVGMKKASVGVSRSSTSTTLAPGTGTAEGASGNNNKESIFSPNSTTTSRLFAPTASSLAKTRSTPAALGAIVKSKTSTIIAQRSKTPPRNVILDPITNSPRSANANANANSPRPGKIFTTPLMSPKQNKDQKQAVIPPPVKPISLAAAATALAAASTATHNGTQSLLERTPATTTLAGPSSTGRRGPASPSSTTGQLQPTRKPRISRSRIIAKLGAQRAAAATTTTTTSSSSLASSSSALSRPSAGAGSRIPRASGSSAVVRTLRVRSSIGTATRRSYAGAKSASRGSDVLMSAKKHARQSEYVRRRSRMAGSAVGAGGPGGGSHAAVGGPDGSMAMDVDED